MRNRNGITESFWNSLPEDKKIRWKLFSWTTALLASLLISKTGIRFFDWLVIGFSTLTAVLIIESQRNLRRYNSATLRKRLIRATVMLGVSGVGLLGLGFFTGIGYVVAKACFIEYFGKSNVPISSPVGLVTVLSVTAGIAIGLFRSFRDLPLEDMFYHLPRTELKKLLITRPFVAKNFPEFAFFELSVIVIAYIYSSTIAQIVQTLLDASKL